MNKRKKTLQAIALCFLFGLLFYVLILGMGALILSSDRLASGWRNFYGGKVMDMREFFSPLYLVVLFVFSQSLVFGGTYGSRVIYKKTTAFKCGRMITKIKQVNKIRRGYQRRPRLRLGKQPVCIRVRIQNQGGKKTMKKSLQMQNAPVFLTKKPTDFRSRGGMEFRI